MSRIVRTVKDSLRHLATILPAAGTRDASKARQPIVEFVRCVPDTVGSWFTRGVLPKGEPLLRLRFFLEDAGYALEETKDMPAPFYHLGEMIAYDALSVEQAKAELGFASQDVQSVYRLALQGQTFGTSGERLRKLEELWESNKVEVQALRSKHRDKVANLRMGVERSSGTGSPPPGDERRAAPPAATASPPLRPHAAEAPAEPGTARGGSSVIRTLVPLTSAVAELAEDVLALPSSERRRFLEAVGRESLTRLARMFERLAEE